MFHRCSTFGLQLGQSRAPLRVPAVGIGWDFCSRWIAYFVTLLRNKADKECEINAKLEGQRDDLIEQINQTNRKNEKILASIKDLEYGIGAKEEKIIAAKDEEMNARIKKQEITSKIESEIRMLNDEVTQMDFRTGALRLKLKWGASSRW